MKMRTIPVAGFVIAGVLALAACAPTTPETSTGADAVSPGAMASQSPGATAGGKTPVVAKQLAFTAMDVATGATVDGTSLAGKDTILWFWASWCPTCQGEAPAVADAAAQLPDGVTLIGIPGRSDVASSQGFIDDYGLGGFQHWYDEDGSIWSAFGVPAQPAFAFINDDGTVQTVPGALGTFGILDAAQKLLDK